MTDKTTRNEQMRARRQARLAWLAEYLVSQDCAHCGRPVKHLAVWHHRDPYKDYAESDRNLSHVRDLAHHAYSQRKIEAALSDLLPLCRSCYANMGRTYHGPAELTRRQLYEQTRYKQDAIAKQKRQYLRDRRAERAAWLDAQLDRPCAHCHTHNIDADIQWCKCDPAINNPDERENLRVLRSWVHKGAAYARLTAELNTLIPLCALCRQQPRHYETHSIPTATPET